MSTCKMLQIVLGASSAFTNDDGDVVLVFSLPSLLPILSFLTSVIYSRV